MQKPKRSTIIDIRLNLKSKQIKEAKNRKKRSTVQKVDNN